MEDGGEEEGSWRGGLLLAEMLGWWRWRPFVALLEKEKTGNGSADVFIFVFSSLSSCFPIWSSAALLKMRWTPPSQMFAGCRSALCRRVASDGDRAKTLSGAGGKIQQEFQRLFFLRSSGEAVQRTARSPMPALYK